MNPTIETTTEEILGRVIYAFKSHFAMDTNAIALDIVTTELAQIALQLRGAIKPHDFKAPSAVHHGHHSFLSECGFSSEFLDGFLNPNQPDEIY